MKKRNWLTYVVATFAILIIFKVGYFCRSLYSGVTVTTALELDTTDINIPLYEIESASRVRKVNSRQVVPLSAYYDRRPLHSHNNSTVILASVLNQLFKKKLILGCEVDGVTQFKPMMTIRTIHTDWWIKNNHPVSYTDIIVTCFDMSVHRKSTVKLIYQVKGILYIVAVEKDVVMPTQAAEHNGVMVCSTGYATPPYLDQWLVYQQTIGIKFIHLNVHVSFVKNLNKSNSLQKFINSGFVRMIVWEEYLNSSQVFLYSQSLKYQDCNLRYQHAYKYIMIVDFDEYFIPLSNEKNVLFYADHLFTGNLIGSVSLPNVRYYCPANSSSAIIMPQDGNITKLFESTGFSISNKGSKCIHLLKAVEEASVHKAYLIPPYKASRYSSTEKSKCYIAHITRYQHYKQKCYN